MGQTVCPETSVTEMPCNIAEERIRQRGVSMKSRDHSDYLRQCWLFIAKLILAQMLKYFPGASQQFPQNFDTGSIPEVFNSVRIVTHCFFKIPFNMILTPTPSTQSEIPLDISGSYFIRATILYIHHTCDIFCPSYQPPK
jgi:hypothetical protein